MFSPVTLKRKLAFWLAYLRRRTPWDTGTPPPELVRTVQGPQALPPGRALDLGCGTGTNVLYLARHGWEAVGVDFVGQAIRKARKRARAAGLPARFFTGDVTRLDRIKGLGGPFDLILDIGCLHSLSPQDRIRYADNVKRYLRPGGTFLLYAWQPRPWRGGTAGLSPDQVRALFGPQLRLTHTESGQERGHPSAWYWQEKK